MGLLVLAYLTRILLCSVQLVGYQIAYVEFPCQSLLYRIFPLLPCLASNLLMSQVSVLVTSEKSVEHAAVDLQRHDLQFDLNWGTYCNT